MEHPTLHLVHCFGHYYPMSDSDFTTIREMGMATVRFPESMLDRLRKSSFRELNVEVHSWMDTYPGLFDQFKASCPEGSDVVRKSNKVTLAYYVESEAEMERSINVFTHYLGRYCLRVQRSTLERNDGERDYLLTRLELLSDYALNPSAYFSTPDALLPSSTLKVGLTGDVVLELKRTAWPNGEPILGIGLLDRTGDEFVAAISRSFRIRNLSADEVLKASQFLFDIYDSLRTAEARVTK